MDGSCKVLECARLIEKRGWCNTHYRRWMKYGDPTMTKRASHGMTYTAEHEAWVGMRGRCNNPRNQSYKHYGGRGIRVCDRWNLLFLDFYTDMGARPSPKHSLDRINNDGNYEPSNCRWTTQTEQVLNQRIRPSNVLGYKGVYTSKSPKRNIQRWYSITCYQGKRYVSKRCTTPEEAYTIRVSKLKELRNDFVKLKEKS